MSRYLLYAGVTLLILAGLVWYFCLHVPPLVVSEETTYITGPLTADGQVDYFKALEERFYPPELATDENGFRLFTRLFGDLGETKNGPNSEFYRLQKYEKLGLDPDVSPTLTLPVHPSKIVTDFYEAAGKEIPEKYYKTSNCCGRTSTALAIYDILGQPWTLEEFPMLADWVSGIDEPLDAIAEALRKPVFFIPLLQSLESVQPGEPQNLVTLLLPDVQLSREIARLYLARAAFRIGMGNIDGAIEDKLTLHRLGRQLTQKACFVQYLVGNAIEGSAGSIPVGVNSDYPLTREQIERLLEGLHSLPTRGSLTDTYEWERFFGLSAIQDIMRARTWSDYRDWDLYMDWGNVFGVIRLLTILPCDWNVTFRRLNELYDTVQEPAQRATLHAFTSARAGSILSWKDLLRMATSGGRGRILGDKLAELWLPAADAFEEAIHRMKCAENLQRLTLAILLCQLEHDTMPDANWAEAIKPYLGEHSEQYFSCPSNPSPVGETTYALIQYGAELPASADTLLLVELKESVPLDKAVMTAEEILQGDRSGSLHVGGMQIAKRSGAIVFLSSATGEEELLRLLGRSNNRD